MNFDWHDGKSDNCLAMRSFDFAYASRVFDGETIEFTDHRESYGETRIIAFGRIDDRLYAVVYTDREDVRWIISAFDAGKGSWIDGSNATRLVGRPGPGGFCQGRSDHGRGHPPSYD